ncbi:FitA-like ribbon-helix-helix domain-containing protein [Pararhizobium sp. DWP3-4]|uniref:FitA-like ribbon-helix-helix domain-containing protein n=1 Tax=unclassified Pararhizobium TaxID=2643050 RepID=UPI003CF5D325
MGEMNIRIEDDLRTRIEDLAKSNARSLDEEISDLLTKAVNNERPQESFADIARQIAAMTPKNVVQTSSLEMLREDRDR